jgi:hypothetical protein
MRKATLVTLMLLLCATLSLAQAYPDQTSQSSNSGQVTVKGCLAKSDSGYTLTDKSGTTYQLTGETSQLGAHVGHEVQIKGAKAEASAAGSSTSTSGSSQAQLQVASMKHISETCSDSKSSKHDMGTSPDKSSDKSSEKPMSEKPPTSK